MTALRGDSVNTKLLGMSKVISDDSAIRALKRMDETAAIQWLQHRLQSCYDHLLSTPWILDVDVTVKPLHGHQEGVKVGYNPHKPGRPSHTYCENNFDETKNQWGWIDGEPAIENLHRVERPMPEPRRQEVVIWVKATALNYRDLETGRHFGRIVLQH